MVFSVIRRSYQFLILNFDHLFVILRWWVQISVDAEFFCWIFLFSKLDCHKEAAGCRFWAVVRRSSVDTEFRLEVDDITTKFQKVPHWNWKKRLLDSLRNEASGQVLWSCRTLRTVRCDQYLTSQSLSSSNWKTIVCPAQAALKSEPYRRHWSASGCLCQVSSSRIHTHTSLWYIWD